MEDRNSMITKYFNQYTNEPFNTPEEADASEKKYLKVEEEKKKKASERAERAKEVEEALKVAIDARKHYNEVLKAFCKDYGSFHYSTNDLKNYNIFDIFDVLNW